MLAPILLPLALGALVGCNRAHGSAQTASEQPEQPASAGRAPPTKETAPGTAATLVATLTVVVQTAGGAPVKGVNLRVLGGTGRPERTMSNERGEAGFTGETGPLQIIIDDPRYPPTTALAQLVAGESQRVVIQALDATQMTGTVVDGDGNPIAGAEIEILSYGLVLPPHTTTDAKGQFKATLAEGSWRMKASKPGKAATWTTLEIPAKQATAALTITVPDSAALVVTTDCNTKGCAKAAVNVTLNNSGFTQTLDGAGRSIFRGLPVGEARVTVRHDADHRRPLLGETKVTLRSGTSSNATIVMSVVEATSSVAGTLVEQDGKRAVARPGSQLVVDIECRGFQRRTIAAADGGFTAPDLIAGECTLTGLRIDPKDPMSGANGLRSVTEVVAPATGVNVSVNDFFRR